MSIIGYPPSRRVLERDRLQRLALGVWVRLDEERLDATSLWGGYGLSASPLAVVGRHALRGPATADAAPPPHGFVGLKRLIEEAHDVAIVPYADSRTHICVPFTHVAVLYNRSVSGLETLQGDLADAIAEAFGPYVDPRLPPRVRCFHVEDLRPGNADDGYLRIYLGNGIFLPERNRGNARLTQFGQLHLRKRGEDSSHHAVLPDGSQAAFHIGQTGIAVSGHASLSPAVCTPVLHEDADSHGTVFYVGRRQEFEGLRFHALQEPGRPPVDYRLTDPDAGDAEIAPDSDLAPERWYGVWRYVARDGNARRREPAFEFMVTPDTLHPGRLLHERPEGPHLQVMGLVAPNPQRVSGVARFWLDLDSDGRPLSDWLAARTQALVLGGNGLAAVYDRERGRFLAAGEHVGRSPVLAAGGRRLRVREIEDVAPGSVLIEDAGAAAALGFIGLPRPDRVRQITFAPGLSAGPGGLSLDWLDAAGLIEHTADADDTPRTGGRQRPYRGLADFHGDTMPPARLQWEPGGGLRQVTDAGPGRLLSPGAEIMLGPLKVRYVPG